MPFKSQCLSCISGTTKSTTPFLPLSGWCSLKLLVTACTFEKVIFVSAVLSPLERMITSSIRGMHHSRTRTQGWINLMRNPVTEIHNLGTQRENHIPPQVANSNIKGPQCYRTSSESVLRIDSTSWFTRVIFLLILKHRIFRFIL